MKQDCPTVNPALKGKGKGADAGGWQPKGGKGWSPKGGEGWQQKGKGKGGKGWQQKGKGKGRWPVDDLMGKYSQQLQPPQEGQPSQDTWGGHDPCWHQVVGSLRPMAPAKTDGNKCGALSESDLTTPPTSTIEVTLGPHEATNEETTEKNRRQ